MVLISYIHNNIGPIHRAGLRRCGAQLGTISVSLGSQSNFTKVCRIGCGAQLGAIGPTGLRPALPIHKLYTTHDNQYTEGRGRDVKEGNVLFNNTLNTFYLQLW